MNPNWLRTFFAKDSAASAPRTNIGNAGPQAQMHAPGGLAHANDKALAARMLVGEERAFEDFFSAYFPGVYRFALFRLDNDPTAAEETAQAALCAAMSKIETYRGEAPLFSWLCTFCRHEISAWYGRQQRSPAALSLADDDTVQAVLDSLESEQPGPEASLRKKELAYLIRQALDRLPPHYGNALEWKYVENLPVVEIAARLKLGPKAAESLLVRARTAFRECFTAVCGGQSNVDTES
jgi:RNA polymerase sigma-70 factor (ECF subfamily)